MKKDENQKEFGIKELWRFMEERGYKYDPLRCIWYQDVRDPKTGERIRLPFPPWGIKDTDLFEGLLKSKE